MIAAGLSNKMIGNKLGITEGTLGEVSTALNRIAGRFDIRPRPVSFELLFEVVKGEWR